MDYLNSLGSKMIEHTENVVTRYIYPPIPIREFDWVALREDHDEFGPFGWGKTEQEAIEDLLEIESEAWEKQ